MYLSYSGWKKFKLECGFAYWLSYVGKISLPSPDDRLGSIFGSVVGKLFEDFYKDEVFRQPQPMGFLMAKIPQTIKAVIKEEVSPSASWKTAGVLKWKGTGPGQNPKAMYANEEELAADVRDAVARGFRTIRHYRFLGKDARAEVQLDSYVKGNKLAGRADFIMRRVLPYDDELILDGKGSQWRDKYVDKRQLQWYAMLFLEKFKRFPDRLGFVFWRYDPPDSVDWVEVNEGEIAALREEVLADIRQIEQMSAGPIPSLEAARKVFLPVASDPKPGMTKNDIKFTCRFCPFAVEAICPDGAKIVEATEKRKEVV